MRAEIACVLYAVDQVQKLPAGKKTQLMAASAGDSYRKIDAPPDHDPPAVVVLSRFGNIDGGYYKTERSAHGRTVYHDDEVAYVCLAKNAERPLHTFKSSVRLKMVKTWQ